jgi:hypothetical protein
MQRFAEIEIDLHTGQASSPQIRDSVSAATMSTPITTRLAQASDRPSANRQRLNETATAALVVNGNGQVSLRHPDTTDLNGGRTLATRERDETLRRLTVSCLDLVKQ